MAPNEGAGKGIKSFCDDLIDGHLGKALAPVIYPVPVAMPEPSFPWLLGIDLLAIGGLALVVRRQQAKSRFIS